MVALIEVTITSLMKSPLIEVIVTSPINEQMVGAIDPKRKKGKNFMNLLDKMIFCQ